MADPIVTLETVRQQLRLEVGDERGAYAQTLIDAAQAFAEGYIKRGITDTWPDATVWQRRIAKQAITALVEHWFVSGADAEVPHGIIMILKLIRVPRI